MPTNLHHPHRGISTIHHEQKVYQADAEGRFQIEDGHVDAMRRHHGLVVTGSDPSAENVALREQLAKSEALLAAAVTKNGELEAQLAAAPKKGKAAEAAPAEPAAQG